MNSVALSEHNTPFATMNLYLKDASEISLMSRRSPTPWFCTSVKGCVDGGTIFSSCTEMALFASENNSYNWTALKSDNAGL